jgi:hypothetical protein
VLAQLSSKSSILDFKLIAWLIWLCAKRHF